MGAGARRHNQGAVEHPRSIFKILPASLWAQALQTGWFSGSPVDLADGYIHFSTAAQLRETAAKHFAGQSDLLVVAIDTRAIAGALKWEPSRGGALFPHLYAPLPVSAAIWARPLPLAGNGRHIFSGIMDDVLRD